LGVGSGFGLFYNRSETQVEKGRVSFPAEGVGEQAGGKNIKKLREEGNLAGFN